MHLFSSFFWKNEPGAVGTPRWMPPSLGCQKCHFCEKRMKKKVNKKFVELIINAAQWEKRKYRTRTPFTGRRLSNSGSRRGASSSSSTQPLHLWPILSFANYCSLGGNIVGSVVSDCSGFTPRANLYERDASSEQRREKHGREITLMLPSQKKKPGNYLFWKFYFDEKADRFECNHPRDDGTRNVILRSLARSL